MLQKKKIEKLNINYKRGKNRKITTNRRSGGLMELLLLGNPRDNVGVIGLDLVEDGGGSDVEVGGGVVGVVVGGAQGGTDELPVVRHQYGVVFGGHPDTICEGKR